MNLSMISKLIASCFLMLILGSCTQKLPYISDKVALNENGLLPVKNIPFDSMFAEPNLNLKSFKKIIIEDIKITHKPDRDDYQLTEKNQQRLLNKFKNQLISELKSTSGLEIVNKISSDTLGLSITITSLKINLPKDIDKQTLNTKVYSDKPAEMSFSGIFFAPNSKRTLSTFTDYNEIELILFERINDVSVLSDLYGETKNWAKKISKVIADFR